MKSIITLIITLAVSHFSLEGQNNDYYKLKDVKSYRFDHLLLDNEKDLATFVKNIDDFNYIEAIKIGDIKSLNTLAPVLAKCYGLREINLLDYKGEIDQNSFDSTLSVEILHIRLLEEKLQSVRHISNLKSLGTLYLYITGKLESMQPLEELPELKELHLIGDFLPNDISLILERLKNQNNLGILGISVDRITDIPESIIKFKRLSKLILYDNLSIAANNGIDDLSEQKISLVFDIYSDEMRAVAISYFSSYGDLSDFELEYLQKIYKGEIFSQQFEAEAETTEEGSVMPFKKEFKPDFPKTSEFNSPYPTIKPLEEQFVIDPSKNNVLYSQTGMKMVIPANSFESEKGETINSAVYIRLIQVNTPVELLFSGIGINQNGLNFNNRFVFNIQASAEKSTARLKDGYQIKTYLPFNPDSSKAHFFDYESNSWQDLGFYQQIFENNFVPIDFYKLENSGISNEVYLFDTSSFDSRFAASRSLFLNDLDNKNQMLFKKKGFYADLDRTWTRDYNKSGNLNGYRIKIGKSLIKIQKVIPKVRNKERQYFKLLDRSGLKIFKELDALKNINFNVLVNQSNKREFNEKYIRNIKYVDLRIDYQKGQNYCEIKLKTTDGYKIIRANITDSDNEELMKKQIRRFEKAYLKYLRILSRRRQEFNELNAVRYGEFKTYLNNNIVDLQKSGQYTELKIHQLGSFGFFNQLNPEFNTGLIAQYTDLKGIPIDIKEIYMIDSRYNTVFKIAVGNLSFYPSYCNMIIATDYSGNLYYANRGDITASNISNNSLIYIKMKPVPGSITTVAAFMNLTRN